MFAQFRSIQILGRPVAPYLVAAAILVAGVLLSLIVRAVALRVIRRRAGRATPDGADAVPGRSFAERFVRAFVTPGLILATLFAALAALNLSGRALEIAEAALVVALTLLLIRVVVDIVGEAFARWVPADGNTTRIRPLRAIATVAIWAIGLVFLLGNLGFNISAVVAGLGIGGIAIALAAQALLGDLFAYFVIVVDRPFELGDFLIFGDILGSVEQIGLKTTRLRSLSGEQIIVANADLTSSRVRNYKRMQERRILFRVGVEYGTPPDTLERIPGMIRDIVEAQSDVRFDRAHFAAFADWSLAFEVVYYVLSPDYARYMDIQQAINLALARRFADEGIAFAFPTSTVHLRSAAAAD